MERLYNTAEIINLARGIAKVMGGNTEIAVHDLRAKAIVAIENSHVTGRKVGHRLDEATYETIKNISDEDGHLIAYGSHAGNGKTLRSSHMIVKDTCGEAALLICVNQDVSALKRLRDEVDGLLQTSSLTENQSLEGDQISYIQRITSQIIKEEIERSKPFSLDNNTAKMNVIRKLERKGVFDVRDAVPQVCQMLAISQATLYNYRRELRRQDTSRREIVENSPVETLLKK